MSSSFLRAALTYTKQNPHILRRIAGTTIITIPTIAIIQGSISIHHFRTYHAHAPRPITPSRGVVVVSPHDIDNETKPPATTTTTTTPPTTTTKGWWHKSSPKNNNVELERARTQRPPIRLLVVGDSLAAGVGISQSATPILPETIGKALSKASGGRAVYWTCVGAPGARVSKIVKQIEGVGENGKDDDDVEEEEVSIGEIVQRGVNKMKDLPRRRRDWVEERQRKKREMVKEEEEGDVWMSMRQDVVDFINVVLLDRSSDKEMTSDNDKNAHDEDRVQVRNWKRWWGQLEDHSKKNNISSVMNEEDLGSYDIAVVLTGLNDLKDAVIPFMAFNDEDDGSRGSRDFNAELLRLLKALTKKMKLTLGSIEKRVTQCESQHNTDTLPPPPPTTSSPKKTSNNTRHRPLVVLPALPIQIVPSFQTPPLRFFLHPLVRIIDQQKRSLAKSHPNAVLFVDSPTWDAIDDFEKGRGGLVERRDKEDVLLILGDVTRRMREKVEKVMEEHYAKLKEVIPDIVTRRNNEEDDDDDDHHHSSLTVEMTNEEATQVLQDSSSTSPHSNNNTTTTTIEMEKERLCEQSYLQHELVDIPTSSPGKQLMSVDGVHPNDDGYDYWGRHIAAAIVQEWMKQQEQHQQQQQQQQQ